RRGTLDPPDATLLEQALLADEGLLAGAVTAVLAPLSTTPRTGAELVRTLSVFIETAGNRRETARRLGLAPRTVAYRLRRIEARLGTRLSGPGLLRLGAVLFARDLLASSADSATATGREDRRAVRPRRGPA
ncbi:MAG: helix-turn-helix domain-containing protein, partial [Thermoleophilia bacterium]|nr:helix-turn-helix domain-containing protein [Thermoleophilia bacterium]